MTDSPSRSAASAAQGEVENGATASPCHRVLLLIAEVTSVLLERPRMRRWIAMDSAQLFVSRLIDTAVMMPNPTEVLPATRDARDDCLVALAPDVLPQNAQDVASPTEVSVRGAMSPSSLWRRRLAL